MFSLREVGKKWERTTDERWGLADNCDVCRKKITNPLKKGKGGDYDRNQDWRLGESGQKS